jgi:HPt (histidine-containing phosphotransfer) domain-containing protein
MTPLNIENSSNPQTSIPETNHEEVVSSAKKTIDCEKMAELRALGGNDFMVKIITQFVQDVAKCIMQLQNAIDNENRDELAKAAHGLKGICRNIGVQQLAELAFAMEQNGRHDSFEKLGDQFATLEQELVRVQKALEQKMAQPSA